MDSDITSADGSRLRPSAESSNAHTGEAGEESLFCLDAFTVALGQGHGRESWFSSTLNLQLASSQYCIACRSAGPVDVRITRSWGSWLLLHKRSASSKEGPNGRGGSRVPPLRARRVTWSLRASPGVLLQENRLFARVEELVFDYEFNRSVADVSWPSGLKRLVFRDSFNGVIDSVAWPASLEELTFGASFNQRIEGVTWPRSLRRLVFGERFAQAIGNVVWPASLRELRLGPDCSETGSDDHYTFWPRNAKQLSAGRVVLPACLQRLTLGVNFNVPLELLVWAPRLQEVSFGHFFDQPIEDVSWPASIRRLKFGASFNQPIARVSWPPALEELTFGNRFNQPIEEVRWPEGLVELKFGQRFDRAVSGTVWPGSLRCLSFVDDFNQPIDRVRWPASLERLSLGRNFDQDLDRVRWPRSLRSLVLGWGFQRPLQDVRWPDELEEVILQLNPWSYTHTMSGVPWPRCLKKLRVPSSIPVDRGVLPRDAVLDHSPGEVVVRLPSLLRDW